MANRIDWGRYVPAGLNWREEFKALGTALGVSAGFSLTYVWRYLRAYGSLFEWNGSKNVLIEGARMPRFAELYDGCMAMFVIVAASMLLLAGLHYGMHFVGGKSIYLMRRLPDRWDLPRRVWIVPLLTMAACLILASLLSLGYLAIYSFATPAQCLVPGAF